MNEEQAVLLGPNRLYTSALPTRRVSYSRGGGRLCLSNHHLSIFTQFTSITRVTIYTTRRRPHTFAQRSQSQVTNFVGIPGQLQNAVRV